MYTTPKRTFLKNLFSLKLCGTVVFYFAPLSFSILRYDRMTVATAWYKEPIKMVYSVPYGMNIKQNDWFIRNENQPLALKGRTYIPPITDMSAIAAIRCKSNSTPLALQTI